MLATSFANKMLISAGLFCIPIIVLSVSLYRADVQSIDLVEKELLGLEFQRPVLQAFSTLSTHRLLAQRVLSGEEKSNSVLTPLSNETDRLMEKIAIMQSNHESDLGFDQSTLAERNRQQIAAKNIRGKWDSLKADFGKLSFMESNARHAEVLGLLRGLLVHSADTSMLNLDPHLDSYNLAVVISELLPQYLDHLQETYVFLEPLIRQEGVSVVDRMQIAVLSNAIKEFDHAGIDRRVRAAILEDPRFLGISPTLHAEFKPKFERWNLLNLQLQELLINLGDPLKPVPNLATFSALMESLSSSSNELWHSGSKELATLISTRQTSLQTQRAFNWLVTLSCILVASILSVYISRTLARSMTSASEQIATSTDQIKNSSTQLNSASQQMASSSAQGAAALEETVASLTALSDVVSANSGHSSKAKGLSQQAIQAAERGEVAMRDLVGAMGNIQQSSARIAQISGVIEDIAFQTNLLALNAAVEAARANEHGKGFAIVAEAVRSLSLKTTNAAKEISELIRESVDRVSLGTNIVTKGSETLANISVSIKEMSELNLEIARSSHEQATGITQITSAMNQLNYTMQSNAASAQQTAASAEVLAGESRNLETQVVVMSETVNGTHSSRVSSAGAHAAPKRRPSIAKAA